MDMSIGKNRLRLVSEILILIGALLYLIAALREARFLGYKMFVENLASHFLFIPPTTLSLSNLSV